VILRKKRGDEATNSDITHSELKEEEQGAVNFYAG